MNNTEKFMEAYKALEIELRKDNKTVLQFEESLENNAQLSICRVMRNYIAHNDTTFLTPSLQQIKFIEKTLVDVRKASHTVKDEMKRIPLIKKNETMGNIAKLLNKYNLLPIETKVGIYILDKDAFIKDLALGNRQITIPKRLTKYKTTNKLERIEDLHKDIFIVYDKEKYVGLLDNR